MTGRGRLGWLFLFLLPAPAAAASGFCGALAAAEREAAGGFASLRSGPAERSEHRTRHPAKILFEGAEECAVTLHRHAGGAPEYRCRWAPAPRAEARRLHSETAEQIRACRPAARASQTALSLVRFWSGAAEIELREERTAAGRAVSLAVAPTPPPPRPDLWIYLLLLLVPLAWSAADRAPRTAARALRWGSGAALVLFIGLRHQVGTDWDNYLRQFDAAAPAGAAGLLAYDPAYRLLGLAAAEAGLGIAAVNLACALLFCAGLLSLARAQPRPWLALVAATPVLVMIVGMSFTRQAAAAGLMMWGLERASRGRTGSAALMLAATPFFHWTAFLLLPLVPLLLARRPLPSWLAPAAGVALGLAFAGAFAVLPAVSEALGHVGVARGALVRSSLSLLAVLIFVAGESRLALPEAERRIASWLAGLALFATLAALAMPTAGDRIGLYAIPFQMMIFARAPSLLPEGRFRRLGAIALAVPPIALLAAWLALTRYGPCLAPYRSYLQRPYLLAPASPEPPRTSGLCQATQDTERDWGMRPSG